MSINLLPDVGGPVLVKVVRIFEEENIVGAKLEVTSLLRSNRNRIVLAVQRKACQHLLVPRSLRGNVSHHIPNRKLLQGQQQPRLMPEIGLAPLQIVWIVRELIAVLHPDWLLGQLARRIQTINVHALLRVAASPPPSPLPSWLLPLPPPPPPPLYLGRRTPN